MPEKKWMKCGHGEKYNKYWMMYIQGCLIRSAHLKIERFMK